ncbi:hypothetical protein BASA81_000581 [Batrachochytrium salamandrivorans]|nr:hypothetical protein BASA81_000581 [Batrachochytrium salamandrivorans]
MDRKELPDVKADPPVVHQPLACCWCCPVSTCIGGFFQREAPPFSVRCMECSSGSVFWYAGMYYDPQRPVEFKRDRFDGIMKKGRVRPGVSTKWQTKSVDTTAPSSKEAGFHIPVRVYKPLNYTGDSLACMVIYHGGGFCIQDKDDFGVDGLCQTLCSKRKVLVVSASYRLAPENPFPAAVHDSLDVLKWIATKPEVLSGLDLSGGIVVAGDSAGGNLACVMSSLCRDGLDSDLTPLAEGTVPKIAAQVLFYPVMFMKVDQSLLVNVPRYFLAVPIANWFTLSYYPTYNPHVDCQERRVAPVAAGFQGLPRTILVSAGQDLLHFENDLAAAKMKEQGVDITHLAYKTMPHGFATFPFLKECEQVINQVCALLDATS